MGTCIAFFVVMGDLGPQIIGDTFNITNTSALRPSIMIGSKFKNNYILILLCLLKPMIFLVKDQ